MPSSEERMQVLKMVQEGKITAEEGAKLLGALDENSGRDAGKEKAGDGSRRWFRVRVTDLKTGKRKMNVNMPLGLVDVGLRMAMKFGPRNGVDLSGVDLNELMGMVRSGAEGRLVEVEDEEDGERTEVFVD
jgi:hypothetical protein